MQALIPYTDRHFQRLDQLLQKSCIIDFTLQRMNLLTPQEDNSVEAEGFGFEVPGGDNATWDDSEDSDESMKSDSSDLDDSPVVIKTAPGPVAKRKLAAASVAPKRKKIA